MLLCEFKKAKRKTIVSFPGFTYLAVAFAVHAILPFIPIEPRLDLESTAA
ncbi:MAG: hypothetical protein IH808_13135 [Proteobacteria bacterium]|jgi:hypothetical protein|nr:hypothetical protein [Pseudomonadota bacterium]